MKKKLNTAAMENELKSGSVFFQKPPTLIQSVDKQPAPTPLPSRQSKTEIIKRHHRQHPKAKIQITEQKSVRNSVRNSDRSEQRPVVSTLPLRRGTKRYSFEFYVDQLDRLRQIKTKEGLKGRNLNLSEIVRSALDEYLGKIGL